MRVKQSRRVFLGALTAGIAFAPLALRADDRSRKTFSFLVISDTHLGYKGGDAAAGQWKKTFGLAVTVRSANNAAPPAPETSDLGSHEESRAWMQHDR